MITVEFWRNEFYVMIEVPKGGDPAEALTVAQDFAVVIDGYAVPVELSLFEAYPISSGVVVRWITQSETVTSATGKWTIGWRRMRLRRSTIFRDGLASSSLRDRMMSRRIETETADSTMAKTRLM